MSSLGIDLERWQKDGRLRFHASRPTAHGLESHLAAIHRAVDEFAPQVVVLDPLTNFITVSNEAEVKAMFMRLMDYLKREQITSLLTSLTSGGDSPETTDIGISSLTDVWLLLRNLESDGERNRTLCVLKARGMAQSNQVRELVLTARGADLLDVVVRDGRVLTGRARIAEQERSAPQAGAHIGDGRAS